MGFPWEKSLLLNFCPRKGLFSATGVRRTPSQEAALGLTAKTTETLRTRGDGPVGALLKHDTKPEERGGAGAGGSGKSA